MPLDRVKVGFWKGEHRTGPGHELPVVISTLRSHGWLLSYLSSPSTSCPRLSTAIRSVPTRNVRFCPENSYTGTAHHLDSTALLITFLGNVALQSDISVGQYTLCCRFQCKESRMRKFLLSLFFLVGLLSGYLIEHFQGMKSRNALEKIANSRKEMLQEREAKIKALQTNLKGIEEKHTREMKEARAEFNMQSTEWERDKANLDGTLKHKMANLDKVNEEIHILNKQLENIRSSDRSKITQQIAAKKNEVENAIIEIEGTRCLTVQVPQSVLAVLGEVKKGGR